jgi:hypothetical protein
MNLFNNRTMVFAALLCSGVHPALAKDPKMQSRPANAQAILRAAPKPYGFQASRANDGKTTVKLEAFRKELLKGIAERNREKKPALPDPVTIRIYVDNIVSRDVPITADSAVLDLLPNEQYSIRLEAISKDGLVIERTEHVILEKKQIRAVNPLSYAGEASLVLRSPTDEQFEIDSDLPGVVQKIGRQKVVFIWKNAEDPRVKKLQGEVDFRVIRNAKGEVTGYQATDATRTAKGEPPLDFKPDEAFIKVDAAFNENSFLWDDMFTCLHTLTFDPGLCRSTIAFWLNVQKLHSQGLGDIPREVLKSNGTSYNLYEVVHLGEVLPNGSYANPNFMGDVTEQYLDQEGLSGDNRVLAKAVVDSMKAYASWLDHNRTVQEEGKVVGYWISDLGSGMDNIGRAPGDNFSSVGYVDELARRIELEKSSARIEGRLGNFAEAKKHETKAAELDRLMNDRYWSPEKSFYFDLVPGAGGKLVRQEDMPTVAGFWPLFSRSASPQQMNSLVTKWYTADTFGGRFPSRSLPPIMEKLKPGSYFPMGGYWRGGNWPPTDIIKAWGEERSGRPGLAAETIHRKLRADTYVSNEALKTLGRKTVYETLGTDKNGNPIPGVQVEPDGRVHETRKDFVGWGGTPHTHGKLRHVLGIRPFGPFGGKPSERNRWVKLVNESPSFLHSTHLAPVVVGASADQKKLFSEGFLEIAPPFALTGKAIEVENYHYRGQPISLKVEGLPLKGAERRVKLTVGTEGPANFNLAFAELRAEAEEPSRAAAATKIMKVKTAKKGTRTFVLSLLPLPAKK